MWRGMCRRRGKSRDSKRRSVGNYCRVFMPFAVVEHAANLISSLLTWLYFLYPLKMVNKGYINLVLMYITGRRRRGWAYIINISFLVITRQIRSSLFPLSLSVCSSLCLYERKDLSFYKR